MPDTQESIKQGTVQSAQSFIKQFNGQTVTLASPRSSGTSGLTDLYTLASGGGLYLRQAEIVPK